jgi:cytoskeletal protein RodZ
MTIGERLKEARLRKGLTLKDVQSELRIRTSFLEALENDRYDLIPGEAYRRAFLRTYAAFLGLDADEILSEYNELYGKPSYIETDYSDSSRGSFVKTVVASIFAVLILFAAIYFAIPEKPKNPDLPAAPIETTEKASKEEKIKETTEKVEPVKESTSTLTLKIIAETEKCWIEVKRIPDQETIISKTLQPGESIELISTSPLKLTAGFPGAIRIFINEREITDFPRRGVLVTTVTVEGLSE